MRIPGSPEILSSVCEIKKGRNNLSPERILSVKS